MVVVTVVMTKKVINLILRTMTKKVHRFLRQKRVVVTPLAIYRTGSRHWKRAGARASKPSKKIFKDSDIEYRE